MEYQRIIHSKHNKSNQIKFTSSMMRSNLCDYSNAYILLKGTITIDWLGDNDATKRADEISKGVTFKNCAPFTECISNINNTQINNAKYMHVMMLIYNLIEYSDNYSKHQEIFKNITEMSHLVKE